VRDTLCLVTREHGRDQPVRAHQQEVSREPAEQGLEPAVGIGYGGTPRAVAGIAVVEDD